VIALRGRESIDTDTHGGGRYVFRVVFQSADALSQKVASAPLRTAIGVSPSARGLRDSLHGSELLSRPPWALS
jgi:hypothetical protein